MRLQDYHTYNEIQSQPEAWADALRAVEQSKTSLQRIVSEKYDQVLFTGCGSTYYLSLAAAALFQQLSGQPARAVPGGELLLNPETAVTSTLSPRGQTEKLPHKTLLVAVSRSGATTETIRAVEQFKAEQRGPVIAITNYGDQPLAGLSDLAIVIEKGQEQSVAQTRSFASMYVAAAGLCALSAEREDLLQAMSALPAVGERLLRDYEPIARQVGENLDLNCFYFLGSGLLYGLACEASLKMKEMSLTHSEPFHFLEFRHGPMSMVDGRTVLVGLVSETNRQYETKVLSEMQQLGAQVFDLEETKATVAFHSQLPETARGVLYLPILQLLAYHRALAKGHNPDTPHNLSPVIKLDLERVVERR